MNATDNLTSTCNLLGLSKPAALQWVTLVHCYCVIVLGTLGNALALWCVATCTRTRRPMKVLLFSVFLPVLVICLATQPVVAEVWAARLTCDPDRISMTVYYINGIVYVILVHMELTSIAAVAVVRVARVWAPHRPKLGIRGAVVLVVATGIFAILTRLVLRTTVAMKLVTNPQTITSFTVLYYINTILPSLITAAAYVFMIVVIQRNKRRLSTHQQGARATTTMDPATRAMLAVFISTLIFGLAHFSYRLMGKQPLYVTVIFHSLYSTHFVVDPLVYMWFNTSYREKVRSLMRKMMYSMCPSCIAPSASQTDPTFFSDHHKRQTSTTNIQEDSQDTKL